MKNFNDQNQFTRSLDLFAEYEKKFNAIPSPKLLTQALKACQRLEDYQRGRQIIEKYSSQLNTNDYFLLTSVIHLLSKFHKNNFICKSFLLILVQSGDVDNAQRMFDQSSHKSAGMYGALLKGLLS